jgi:hypothetical protein
MSAKEARAYGLIDHVEEQLLVSHRSVRIRLVVPVAVAAQSDVDVFGFGDRPPAEPAARLVLGSVFRAHALMISTSTDT